MKKKLLMLLTVLAGFVSAYADNGISVSAVSIPQGRTGTIDIELKNDDYEFTAFTFKLTLPEGLSFVLNDNGKPTFEKSDRFDESHSVTSAVSGQVGSFGCLSGDKAAIKGKKGVLLKVYVTASGDLDVGTNLTATLSELTFTTPEVIFDDVDFNVTISENRITFDETSTTLPVYTAGEKANVRMKRTIKANEWSTIVLPFTLTKKKAEAAFGSDVQLAEFAGFETEYADDDDITPDAITLNFTSYTMTAQKGMTGGKLFLIKTTKDITEFEADNATLFSEIADVEKEDEYETSGKMTGTFVKTKVPADGLFLSSNKFWYSVGKTNIKAFRGWFELGAVLDKETDFEANIRYVIDEEPTIIEGIGESSVLQGAIYNVNGQLVGKDIDVNTLPKGIYYVDGKKVFIY